MVIDPFNHFAKQYDQWFDTPNGRLIFAQETACLSELIGTIGNDRWLEIGVGTGRFAQSLGIREGIDPSDSVLAYASNRGIKTTVGYGENLPFTNDNYDGILMVVTICFLTDPIKTFKECWRVLKEKGCLIVGFVPADSSWGELYTRKKNEGHRFYSSAKFYTSNQIVSIADKTGFLFNNARSCLFTAPGEPVIDSSIDKEIVTNAGFTALQFIKKNKR